MLSFHIPHFFCLITSGICLAKGIDLIGGPTNLYGMILFTIGIFSMFLGAAILGNHEASMYREGFKDGTEKASAFFESLKEEKKEE